MVPFDVGPRFYSVEGRYIHTCSSYFAVSSSPTNILYYHKNEVGNIEYLYFLTIE